MPPAPTPSIIAPVRDDPAVPTTRLLSLDAFRGLVIVLMFLVNVAGNDPAFPSWFAHRGWNEARHGQGLADFVFPWFLFVVGASIPLSMTAGRGAKRSAVSRLAAAFRRGIAIYLLGTLLWCATIAFNPATPITIEVLLHWDILPLIGFAYFLGVVLWLLPWWTCVMIVVGILAAKWAILTQISHPDAGTLDWAQRLTFQDWLRRELGWFGTLLTQGLPSVAVVLLGSLSMQVLRHNQTTPAKRSIVLVAGGAMLVALSWGWHTLWYLHPSIGMPFSKDYFTSSYVLLAAGSGAMILGALHEICDVRRVSSLGPLRVLGMNAIAIYLAAELLWKMVLTRWHLACPDSSSAWMITAIRSWLHHAIGSTAGSWALVALYIFAYWLLAAWMHRRSLFLRL